MQCPGQGAAPSLPPGEQGQLGASSGAFYKAAWHRRASGGAAGCRGGSGGCVRPQLGLPPSRWYVRRRRLFHMPTPGPAAPTFTAAGDEKAWNVADWHWDPLAMTATAVGAPASGVACAAISGARPAAGGLAAVDGASHGGATPSASSGYAAVDATGVRGSSVAATAPPAARTKGKAGGRQRKAAVAGPAVCQADGCGLDLSGHTFYHQRNK